MSLRSGHLFPTSEYVTCLLQHPLASPIATKLFSGMSRYMDSAFLPWFPACFLAVSKQATYLLGLPLTQVRLLGTPEVCQAV